MKGKIPVAIVGATGRVGQQYLQLLHNHPWFEISHLAASNRSAGVSYGEALSGRFLAELPPSITQLPLYSVEEVERIAADCRLVFSALTSEAAAIYEERYAESGLGVVSSASCHRMSPDVPLLIPEVNPDHLALLAWQRQRRGWSGGFIVAKPNCSLQSYVMALTPLLHRWGLRELIVTTLQAISGAGYPGLSGLDILDNVIPYIAGEEEKLEQEPLKIWAKASEKGLEMAAPIKISAHCNRVPVLDGHMACVSFSLKTKATIDQIVEVWQQWSALDLPSAPKPPLLYHPSCDRPQPRLDRYQQSGMAVTLGRLRPCHVLDYRFVALSHNAVRGAAGGGVLCAELLRRNGYLN